MLEVRNIKYSYNNDYQALKGVSLKILYLQEHLKI